MVEIIQVMCLVVLILIAGLILKYFIDTFKVNKELEELRRELACLKDTVNKQHDVIRVIVKWTGKSK